MQSIEKIIINILRLTLIFAVGASIFYNSWFNLFISSFTIILTFAPAWIGKKYNINIPLDFELVIILFIYTSLFLGEIINFYNYFWWWDILLHFSSAIAFAFIGFIVLFILFKTNKINSQPIWVAIFSFCFSISIGVMWEIFEFSMDQAFGLNMQKSGLIDTMGDLMSDGIGAMLASSFGYYYMKGKQISYLSKLVSLFVKKNNIVSNGK